MSLFGKNKEDCQEDVRNRLQAVQLGWAQLFYAYLEDVKVLQADQKKEYGQGFYDGQEKLLNVLYAIARKELAKLSEEEKSQ